MQNPLTCHAPLRCEEQSDEEYRTLPEDQLKTKTLRYAQSDMNIICVYSLVISAESV